MRYFPWALLILLLTTGSAFCGDINVATPVTVATINTAIASATPGDVVIVPDGDYPLPSIDDVTIINFNTSGTLGNEITFRAETPGGVRFGADTPTGKFRAEVNGDFWIIRDFFFDDIISYSPSTKATTLLLIYGDNNRITNNYFKDSGEVTALASGANVKMFLGAADCEVDHNTFENWPNMKAVVSEGTPTGLIHHNYFSCPSECEDSDSAIHYGSGSPGIVNTDYNAVIELNYFDDIVGDPETISNKSSSNTYQYNVFNKTNGLQIRNGDDIVIDSNYFFDINEHASWPSGGGQYAISVFGDDNTVTNNYIEDADFALRVSSGTCVDYDSACESISGYDQVSGLTLAHNTVVSNTADKIGLGVGTSGRVYHPINSTFVNNLYDMGGATWAIVVIYENTGPHTKENNVCNNRDEKTYESGGGGWCNTQETTSRLTDDGTVFWLDGSYGDGSNLIGTVNKDILGGDRVTAPDPGAHEYGAGGNNKTVAEIEDGAGHDWTTTETSLFFSGVTWQ